MIRLPLIALALCPVNVAAEALPDVQTCLNIHVGRYEWLLDIHADTPVEYIPGGIWHVEQVLNCGTIGIVRCDLAEDLQQRVACQKDLRADLDDLTASVKRGLTDPAEVTGEGWPERLYSVSHALAHGSSAGPDCANDTEVMQVWCEANQATNRLRNAMLAWEVGRYLDITPDAIEAGWAAPPPPIRPRQRP
ncbi:hypothetical protein [Pseudooceanicola sp. MF1-13]|uniref:hypothetical protein n=1 Tax=Pseudooceanicola sp. MF1-13 TaxID=3379095 RepID=UPI0038917E53